MNKMIEKAKAKKEKMMAFAFVAFATVMLGFDNAFAAGTGSGSGTGIFNRVTTMFTDLEAGIKGVATAVAGCAAMVCLVMILISGERSASKWVSWLKRIAIAYACIFLLTEILSLIETTATGK